MEFLIFYPEAFMLTAVAVFLIACVRPPKGEDTLWKAAVCIGLLCVASCVAAIGAEGALFYAQDPALKVGFATYRVNFFSQLFKLLLAVAFFLICFISKPMKGMDERHHPEYYLLLSTATLGMMMLVSATELLTLYICLELASYSLYVLVPLRRNEGVNIEAAIKYLLIGAASSAILLYGFSFIYGATHTTNIEILVRRMPELIKQPTVMVGMILFAGGLFFKMSVFPFHFWAPDVYQGAANEVTAFIATASKIAAAAVLLRFFTLGVPVHSLPLEQVLVALAVATMTLGNLAAIAQTDMKRMLAYSSISQAGYVLVGVLALGRNGFAAVVFYAAAYLVMTFAAFMIVVRLSPDGRDLPISGFAGLYKRSPLLALTLMVSLLSLGGVPPFVGFTGKWFLFSAAMERHLWGLVLIGVINSTISVYYYLMVIKQAYLREPRTEFVRGEPVAEEPLSLSGSLRLVAIASIAFITFFGVAPGRLLELARYAIAHLM